jgi:hypothetical protein
MAPCEMSAEPALWAYKQFIVVMVLAAAAIVLTAPFINQNPEISNLAGQAQSLLGGLSAGRHRDGEDKADRSSNWLLGSGVPLGRPLDDSGQNGRQRAPNEPHAGIPGRQRP